MEPSNGRKSQGRQQDTKRSSIPAGMKPVLNDPKNIGGWIDPNTGYEYNRFGKLAWVWSSGGAKKYTNPTDSLPSSEQSPLPPLPSKGGASVGGQAGQVGNTGMTGDMQSQSGVMPSSMGLSQGTPQPPMPMPSAKTMVPVAQTVNSNSTDVGQVFMPPIPVSSGVPVQPAYVDPRKNLITKMQGLGLPNVQRPVAITPAQRPVTPMPIPAMPQTAETQPWWREYLSYFGL